MFRPAEIHHVELIIEEDKVSSIISKLHETGVCELKEANAQDFESKFSYDELKEVDDAQSRLSAIIDALEDYKKIPQVDSLIKSVLWPKPPLKHRTKGVSTKSILKDINNLLNSLEPKVNQRLERLSEINEKINCNKFLISNLLLLPGLTTSTYQSSDSITCYLGLVLTDQIQKLEKKLNENTAYTLKTIDKTRLLLTLFTEPEKSSDIGKLIHTIGFEVLEVPYQNKAPKEIISALRLEVYKLEAEVLKIKWNLKKLSKENEKTLIISEEEVSVCREKIEALNNLKTSESFSIMETWVPAKQLMRFREIIEGISKQNYIKISEKDDAPTIYNNPPIIDSFEAITNLYSPPKYKSFDPTPLLAISFALFFGFMLTDFAYGIILMVMGLVMMRATKYNPVMKKTSIILLVFGVTTASLGVVFGSYFGNFFQELGIKMPMLIDPMKQVMLTLMIALGLGTLHLVVGLITGFYENIYQKRVKNAFADQAVWLVFIAGIFLIIAGLKTFGLGAIILAIIMQVGFKFIDGGFVTAVLSVFDFSGFLGDLFSYARLMALAIGTAGIALAVNFMVFLVIQLIPYIGWPIAILIFIAGHLFNISMNGLGAFIHSTRLHFLEFFSKFYEGGGRLYKPFKAVRKITYIE